MKKLLTIAAACLTIAGTTAQTKTQRFGVNVDANFRSYKGELGNNFFKFNDKSTQLGGGLHYYLNRWMDLSLFANYGKQAYNGTINNVATKLSLQGLNTNLNLRLKADNGWLLKETAKVGPYLTVGLGYMNQKSLNYPGGAQKFGFLTAPLGAGLRFKIHPIVSIIAQTSYVLTFNDKYDGYTTKKGNDAMWENKIGVLFNLGKNKSEDTRTANDDDGDGVANNVDRCPNTPKGAKVDKFGCTIVDEATNVELREIIKNIYFETNSENLKSESYGNLDKLVLIMNKFPEARLIVEGHTDSDGDDDYNMNLSQRRANAVKAYLVSKGVSESRIAAKGYGETMPVASNKTDEGKAKNRRVELILTK